MSSSSDKGQSLSLEQKRALLARALKKKTQTERRLPLSFAQQRLWFIDQLEPGSSLYNIPSTVRLKGRLNVAALEQTLNEIVRRHEVLRTHFEVGEGEPVQVISPHAPINLSLINLRALEPAAREKEAQRLATEEAQRPFDLSRGPLLRSTLLQLSEDEHIALFTTHHIVSDGWSMGVLIKELVALYQAFSTGEASPLPELPVQYADFAVWQRGWLQGDVLTEQLSYWKAQLHDAPQVLDLPTDYPRPAVQSHRGDTESFSLSEELTRSLKELSRKEGVTLYMTLLAAFQTLLYRYSGQTDILVGTPIANRNRAETEPLIGFFVNTLVLRARLSPQTPFTELLKQAREVCLGAYAHQDVPFEKLVEELQPERSLSHSPLFQVMFILQNAPEAEPHLSALQMEEVETESRVAKFDLTLSMGESGGRLSGAFSYNTDLFEAETIRRMVEHFQMLLESLVAAPEQRLSEPDLLTEAERRQLLYDWNETDCFPVSACLHQLFAAQAERTPEAVALVCGDTRLSYRELDARANRLAHLLRGRGVAVESLVALCLERSAEMVIALLAVLKAGGAYVPLDPQYPKERLRQMLDDSGARLLVTHSKLRESLPETEIAVLSLDEEHIALSAQSDAKVESSVSAESSVSPENLAYVIYTSGSTGQPKGVQVTHANVSRLFAATHHCFNFSSRDVWSLFHSYAFDFSVWEIWGALLHGGRLVVVPYFISRSPEAFYDLLTTEGVTVLNQTPSMFRQLIGVDAQRSARREQSLRLIIFGGEALEFASLQPWIARHGDEQPQLVNMYGITETTVHVTYKRVRREDVERGGGSVIGRPLADLQVYILDSQERPVPIGVRGEIYVGGGGLGRGYLKRAELSAEKFVADGLGVEGGRRLYRTGDEGRYLNNGEVEYVGRLDEQVKVRGYRIELGEIESVLVGHESVRECVVVAREEDGGDKRLVAYVVWREGGGAALDELRNYLRGKLPDYMVPHTFVVLDEIPLTGNGKLDRRALPSPDRARPELEGDFVSPRDETERILAEIWSKVLDVEAVGIHDNFFSLGGDSIRSIEVRSLAERQGLSFSLQQLFQYQTIYQLSQQLRHEAASSAAIVGSRALSLISGEDSSALPTDVEDAYPLAMLQAGMLFHSEYTSDSAAYHDIFSFHLRAPLDTEALRSAIERLLLRHPVLRTSFDLTSFSEPLQLVHRSIEVPLLVEDISHLSHGEQDAYLEEWRETEKKRHIDWSRPPLLRFYVQRRSVETFQLQLSFHHAILDGWSVASLLTELFKVYFSQLAALPVPTEQPPVTTFRDFIALERQALASEEVADYWTGKLSGLAFGKLPRWPLADAAAHAATQSRLLNVPVTPEVSDGLKRLAQAASTPVKSVLLAAHLRVVSLLTGNRNVTTGLVSNGRPEQADGERVLGLFLNTLPFRADLSGGTWLDLVKQTFEAEREMLPFRWYPLATLQQRAGGEPLFETGFNFNHFHIYDGLQSSGDAQVLGYDIFEQTNLTLGAVFSLDVTTSQIQLQLNYNAAELSAAQIAAIGSYYSKALQALALDPSARYETQCLVPDDERRQMLFDWNETALAFPQDACLHQLIEAQVERTPEAVALVCGDTRLSYRELDTRANRLAHLLRGRGVMVESLVALCLDRSAEMVVALLAVLKAGGAYVPLDPQYPKERLRQMLDDSGAKLLLTQSGLRESLPETEAEVLCLDEEHEALSAQSDAQVESGVSAENLAYVIYTSGSTGQPKGVMISHGGVCNTLRWRQVAFSLDESDSILQNISIAFDPSVWQIFGALVTGYRLVLARPEGHKDVAYLSGLIEEEEITLVDFVPSMLQMFIGAQTNGACRSLRHVFCGGEILPAELQDSFFRVLPGEMHNMYGPTECSIDAISWTCRPEGRQRSVPIGKPVANKQIYLLDEHLQPVPVAVTGQIYIGGVGLSRGYIDKPDATAEQFIPNPFSREPGAHLYRTGDLARYLPDGRIEYLGRIDEQVKIRGQRIELGEIESVLSRHQSVRESAVLAHEDERGDKRLVAYVVAGEETPPVFAELRRHLREQLPQYMIPSSYVLLDSIPRTPNGKLDRRALPESNGFHAETEVAYTPPRTDIERVVAEVWQGVLQVERVGVNDNFFDLGGHSLLMLRVHSKLRELLLLDMSIVEMFSYPTVSSLAERLQQEQQQPPSFKQSEDRAAVSKKALKRRRQLRQKHDSVLEQGEGAEHG